MEYEILQSKFSETLTEQINNLAKDDWYVIEYKCIVDESENYWSALMARENPPPKPEGAVKWKLKDGTAIYLTLDDVLRIEELSGWQRRHQDLTLEGSKRLMNSYYGQQE